MANMILLVLDDPGKIEDVLHAWITCGVSGTTVFDTRGLQHELKCSSIRDDFPVFASIRAFTRSPEEPHNTLFAVVGDDFDVEALAEATERIVGPLSEPGTGILVQIPVTRVWGLRF